MQWRNSADRYGAGAQILHWALFALIAFQLVEVQFVDAFARESAGRAFVLAAHETGGMTVLALVYVRLVWKYLNDAPLEYGPLWQQRAARLAHASMYVLLVAIPLIGYVVASARGQDPLFFGVPLPAVVDGDRALARTTREIHETLSWTLAAIVAAHAAAALWHHFVARDAVMRKMLPRRFTRDQVPTASR
jgi:cytochrome b561